MDINCDPQLPTNTNPFHHANDFYDSHPLECLLEWYQRQCFEHQVELAEFIGRFCYEPFFVTLEAEEAKVFACKEYLKSNVGIIENEERLLLFIDGIIEFIIEINELADSGIFACEQIIFEFSNIISLYSMINELPKRSKIWLTTYKDWQHFRKRFSIFQQVDLTEKSFAREPGYARKKLIRHL